jgi:IclR family pca regulon transcriptional regulator
MKRREARRPEDDLANGGVGALAKGLAVLAAFDPERPMMAVAELAERAGLNRASAYRIVSLLEEFGFLQRLDQDGRRTYRPGIRVLTLGRAALESLELPSIALPYLQALWQECGQTVNLACLDDTHTLILVRLKTTDIVNIQLFVGSRLPAHCTSVGKAILAWLPEEELRSLIGRLDFGKLTEHTVQGSDQLRRQLEEVRHRGIAVSDQELAIGLRAVAAPVFSGSRVVAAINIAVPAGTIDEGYLETTLGPSVRLTADQISQALTALSFSPAALPGSIGEGRLR